MAEACSTKRTRNGQFHPDGICIRGKGHKRGNILTRLKYRIDELKHFYQPAIDKLIESNKYRERHLMVFISIPYWMRQFFNRRKVDLSSLIPHTGHPYAILEVNWPIFIIRIAMQKCGGILGIQRMHPCALIERNCSKFLLVRYRVFFFIEWLIKINWSTYVIYGN